MKVHEKQKDKEVAPSYIEVVLCERIYNASTGKWEKDPFRKKRQVCNNGNEVHKFWMDTKNTGKTKFIKNKKKNGKKD
jgi:hypothetical protein